MCNWEQETVEQLKRAGFWEPGIESLRCLVSRHLADGEDMRTVELWMDQQKVPRFWYSATSMQTYTWRERFLLATGQMEPKGPTECPYSFPREQCHV